MAGFLRFMESRMQPGRFTERRTKAANYHARAGETIAGRLVRGADGKFGSGGTSDPAKTTADAQATIAQNRAANARPEGTRPKKAGGRKRRAAKPKKARAAKKPRVARARKPKAPSKVQQQRTREREATFNAMKSDGLNRKAFDAITTLADGGKADPDMLSAMAGETGLVEKTADGSYQLTRAGQSYVRAANRGNVDHAKRALVTGKRAVEDASMTTKASDQGDADDDSQADVHDGVMVAFYVPSLVADVLVRETARARGITPQPAAELHCTLALLGETDDLATSKYSILAGVERYARYASAIIGTVSGVGRFQTDEDDGTNALYASVDAPDLQAWRDNLVQTLADQSGQLPANDHGYTPHITLAYLPTGTPTPTLAIADIPVTFDTISVAWGAERYNFPLLRSGPMVFKDASGRLRWVTISSSAYRDRDREIVSTKALADDVARADADGAYGPLRWWHQPGLDIGDCDFNAMMGRLLVESGTFRSEAIGEKVKAAAPTLQVSIGFLHPAAEPDGDGVFSTIRRFERSLLPSGYASNLYTQLFVEGEQPMDERKKAAARALFGDEVVARIEAAGLLTEKSADAAGVAFKAAPPAVAAAPPATPEPDTGDADAAIAVGDMDVAEFTAVMKAANQPVVDVLTALVNAFTGTTQQAATKEVAVETRLSAAERDVATLKTQLATAERKVTELGGDLPASIASRRASLAGPTVSAETVKTIAKQIAPDTGFIGFLTGEQPQQGA